MKVDFEIFSKFLSSSSSCCCESQKQ